MGNATCVRKFISTYEHYITLLLTDFYFVVKNGFQTICHNLIQYATLCLKICHFGELYMLKL